MTAATGKIARLTRALPPTVSATRAPCWPTAPGTAEFSVGVINAGTVSAGAGTLEFLGAATNTGVIDAAAGLVSFAKTVAGAGTLAVGATGTLSLLLGAASTQMVDFQATSGLLDLTKPLDFGGFISGFGASDHIDLIGTAETAYSYAGSLLTVTDGTTTVAKLHFTGSYSSASFTLASDGHSGTIISFS